MARKSTEFPINYASQPLCEQVLATFSTHKAQHVFSLPPFRWGAEEACCWLPSLGISSYVRPF